MVYKKCFNMKKTFLEHLQEFRDLILKCVSVLIFGCVVVGCLFPYFADIMYYPLKAAIGEDASALQGLVTTSPMGIFSVLIQVCFLGGLAISLPIMVYFVARFIAPGLTRREKGVLVPASLAVLGLFVAGSAFSYFYVLPASLKVAISLNKTFGFQLIWSAPEYYGLVVWMTLGIGLCFEFPLAILLLIYLNIVSTKQLRGIRKHMIVATLIAAGLITPTSDPFSLIIVAVPLYALYELAIIVGRRFETPKVEVIEKRDLPWPVEEES